MTRARGRPRRASCRRPSGRAGRAGDGRTRPSRPSWCRSSEAGELGPKGAERVEFLIAPNSGVPAGPLREIASGGELSRMMLALMTIATGRAGAETVVFDEVDAGVGGNTARAIGAKLRRPRRAPTGRLHHPPAAGGLARLAALPRHQGACRRRDRGQPAAIAQARSSRLRPTSWSRSCAGCWEPTPATGPPASMRKDCSKPPRMPLRGRGSARAPLRQMAVPRTPTTHASRGGIGAVAGPARRTFEPLEIAGPVRLGKRTKHLVKSASRGRDRGHRPRRSRPHRRRGPGRVAAWPRSSTWRRRPPSAIPNPGPLILVRGGVRLIDAVDAPLFDSLSDGDRITIRDGTIVLARRQRARRGPRANARRARERRARPAGAGRGGDRAVRREHAHPHPRGARAAGGPPQPARLRHGLPRPPRAAGRARHRLQARPAHAALLHPATSIRCWSASTAAATRCSRRACART